MKELDTDNELIEKLRIGDVEAFDLVYHRYAGKLYAFSLKYLRSKEEAEELVQSVFLKVWENQKNIKKDTSFKSYLFTIAYNEICNLFRRRKYQQNFFDKSMIGNPEASVETEDQIDFQFVLEQVEQIISRLPEKQKTIFLKSRQEGKSTKEIADELGLSPGTVDNYISESLKFIRTNLKDNQFSLLLFISLFIA
ncbi:RNA polymerase ECF-type sigma factor [Aquipluma nitroreducens]|uniref:RNA polymerase sigma factor n=1 Tax=Aquipluma nitroreducens TaxID=2010828 RepID=A0A5K7SBY0_9BACT|nr:RNA polymerase sigma-70 factor [Aquipluma nitroreducens]BBE18989.1 RNA polymerase ECF-type sigma factor [Aquipluma nitroreducens]